MMLSSMCLKACWTGSYYIFNSNLFSLVGAVDEEKSAAGSEGGNRGLKEERNEGRERERGCSNRASGGLMASRCKCSQSKHASNVSTYQRLMPVNALQLNNHYLLPPFLPPHLTCFALVENKSQLNYFINPFPSDYSPVIGQCVGSLIIIPLLCFHIHAHRIFFNYITNVVPQMIITKNIILGD